MTDFLLNIQSQALADIEKAPNAEVLYKVQVKYLGRKGEFTLLMQGIADLPKEEKPAMGKMCNEVKAALEEAFAKKEEALETADVAGKLHDAWVDVTMPAEFSRQAAEQGGGGTAGIGHIHPLSQVQYEVEQIWSDMGFAIEDGPEAESDYYNFEGLNFPPDHPARDMQDTFFLKGAAGRAHDASVSKKHGRLVLRTHTSPVQVRTMEKYGAPLRVIVPGRVFRNEATDARHEHTFNQVEGILVDTEISLAHLKGVMQEFLTRLFGREMKVRFRPGYFPFVEPGLELDMSCTFCGDERGLGLVGPKPSETKGGGASVERSETERQWGNRRFPQMKGCRVCKQTGWIEFMGAGMVHPNVLKAGGVDAKKFQGWAFGFGLTRLVMMRYGIDDIRLLTNGDLRFLEQF